MIAMLNTLFVLLSLTEFLPCDSYTGRLWRQGWSRRPFLPSSPSFQQAPLLPTWERTSSQYPFQLGSSGDSDNSPDSGDVAVAESEPVTVVDVDESETILDGVYESQIFELGHSNQTLSSLRADIQNRENGGVFSRRDWLLKAALLTSGTLITMAPRDWPPPHDNRNKQKPKPKVNKDAKSPMSPLELSQSGRLEPVNFTKVAAETKINVTLQCNQGCLTIDEKNFTKIQTKNAPSWIPPLFSPRPKIVKIFPNSEVLLAAVIAGSATEMARTFILYPLQTVKTRIQTDPHNFTATPPPIQERLVTLGMNIRRNVEEGNLYAGISPSLLVSVPATGVYYGVRDVTRRMLSMTSMDDVALALMSALVADVASLSFRTPADALALRLQAQDDKVGDWLGDSLRRLPAVILTDLPYLLSKILLNRLFIHGSIGIHQYTEYAILAAIVSAFLTTPFDVARTRILVDSDDNRITSFDGGVLRTMKRITREGRGGIANLFAGWLERVLYLGIGRGWLEPIQIIGYVGIRDTVLLEWF